MFSKSDIKTKKTLVRNVEQKINRNNNVCISKSIKVDKNKNSSVKKVDDACGNNQLYKNPKLHSSKAILNQIKKVEGMTTKDYLEHNKTPDSGAEKEITKRLNFHFDEKIYKDLVALNINDSEAKSRIRKSITVPKHVLQMSKDIEPNLDDFYKDEIRPDKPILPSVVKVKFTPVIKYNGRDIHDKIRSWDCRR